jgi:DNA modification methylase
LKYQAKSDLLRRSNVWTEDGDPSPSPNGDSDDVEYRMSDVWDETEILRGKRHVCEKPRKVNEIPVRAHTNPGERVLDLFSGSGSMSETARALERTWVAVEKNHGDCAKIARAMGAQAAGEETVR